MSLTIKFSGFTSRCTTLWRCNELRALISWAMSRRALGSERLPPSSSSNNSQPRTWSMTT